MERGENMSDKLDMLLTALTEFRNDFNEYKKENKEQFEEYKKENSVQFSELKVNFTDLSEQFAGFKGEFEDFQKENKEQFADLREQFNQHKLENKVQFDQFKAQLTRVEDTLVRLEENQSQDIVAVLKQIDKKLDDRDNELQVLNKRLFKTESDVERLTRQLEY